MQFLKDRGFEILDGEYGLRLVLKSLWTPKVSDEIKRRGVKELELNYAKGWKRSGLEFLQGLTGLQALEIIDWKIEDVSDIHHLRNLKVLKVNTYCKTELDFSAFPSLERVSFEWRAKAKSLFQCSSVVRVFINNYGDKNLTAFANMKQLKSLSLKSPKIERLGDISSLQELRVLGIGNALKLLDLRGLEVLHGLRRLEINRCPKIPNIGPISNLRGLEHLELNDNGEIESLQPLRELKRLQRFYFCESTNIVDGGIALLKELPELRDLSFEDRKHYDYWAGSWGVVGELGTLGSWGRP